MSCDCGETSSNRSRIFADDNDFQNAATMQRGDARAAEVARMQREWNDVINQQREADSGRGEVSRRVVVSEDDQDEECQRAVVRGSRTDRTDRAARMDGQYAGQWCGGARAQCNAEYAGQLNNNESVQEQYNEQGEIMYDANNADMREFLSDVYVAEYMIAYNDSRHEIVQQYMGHLAEVADNIEFDARTNTYTANNIVYFAEYDLIFDANAELFTDGINTIALQDLVEEHDMYDGHGIVADMKAKLEAKFAAAKAATSGLVGKVTTAAAEAAKQAAKAAGNVKETLQAAASQVANSAGEAAKQAQVVIGDVTKQAKGALGDLAKQAGGATGILKTVANVGLMTMPMGFAVKAAANSAAKQAGMKPIL